MTPPKPAAILPTRRLFSALGGLLALSLVCFVVPVFMWIWAAGLCIFIFAVLQEGWLLRQVRYTYRQVSWQPHPTVGRSFELTVTVDQALPRAVHHHVLAITTDLFELPIVAGRITSQNSTAETVQWTLIPCYRGDQLWPEPTAHFWTRWHLLETWQALPTMTLPVYPSLQAIGQQGLNPQLLMAPLGIKLNRLRKADQAFESLRPYSYGDNYRHIDWKATARSPGLITRQFEIEHHHDILVCLDTSRMMGTVSDGLSKLDWAIEACLHLAIMAQRFQDRLGLLVFSDHIQKWQSPVRQALPMVLQNVYPLQSTRVESNFQQLCTTILNRQKKRSLILFLSDFLDAASLEPSLPAFAALNRKHLSLFIGVEDPAYHRYLEAQSYDTALDIAKIMVAQDAMQRRLAALQQMRQLGLKALSASPQTLVERAMQAYLEIKLQGAL